MIGSYIQFVFAASITASHCSLIAYRSELCPGITMLVYFCSAVAIHKALYYIFSGVVFLTYFSFVWMSRVYVLMWQLATLVRYRFLQQ